MVIPATMHTTVGKFAEKKVNPAPSCKSGNAFAMTQAKERRMRYRFEKFQNCVRHI